MSYSRLRRLCAFTLLTMLTLPEAGALSNTSGWAQDGIAEAERTGLAPASFSSLDARAYITREEFCSVTLNIWQAVSGKKPPSSVSRPFTDCDSPSVAAAYELGLVSGRGNGIFDPGATIQRQDLCVMLYNILDTANISAPPLKGEAAVSAFPDRELVSGYASYAMTSMVDYGIVSGVASTTQTARLDPRGTATREQALVMANRFRSTFSRPAETPAPAPTEPDKPEPSSPSPEPDALPQTDAEKREFVYGADGAEYQSAEEAEANMTEISVPVWRLQSDGSKTAGTASITVHARLAPLCQKIFEEIFNGDEKFPIKNVGGYSWRWGEHGQGTAIDINWEENMEATINEDGSLTPTTGTHWSPGEDPYSIPEGGDVYNAFTKYGFSWGGNAWPRKRDYMHFSYFGR